MTSMEVVKEQLPGSLPVSILMGRALSDSPWSDYQWDAVGVSVVYAVVLPPELYRWCETFVLSHYRIAVNPDQLQKRLLGCVINDFPHSSPV
ncbi:MAG: hypothetical protein ABW166_00745 [Sedimenticola sp.]